MNVLIGILSGIGYVERRERCRRCWNDKLGGYFLVGRHDHLAMEAGVDYYRLNVPDDYPSLPQKTRAFCLEAFRADELRGSRCWDYLFKCDDDTYIAADRFLAALPLLRGNYIGAEYTPGWGRNTYGHPYASGGGGYFLSRKAAKIIAENMTEETGCEDVLVGQHLHRAGIGLTMDNRFVGAPYLGADHRPLPGNAFITVHGIDVARWEDTHKRLYG